MRYLSQGAKKIQEGMEGFNNENECSIVQDILPLYVEEMVSDDTVSFVREHLKDCPRCRAELENCKTG